MSELPSEADVLFAQLEQEYANEDDHMYAVYGVKHDCHCGDDIEAGRLEEVPECYLAMVDEAMQVLKDTRLVLAMIADAPEDIPAKQLRLIATTALSGGISE
jgi:hypothetical protein